MSMIEFCVDALWTLGILQYLGKDDKFLGYPFAVSRLVLVISLGFSVETVDDAWTILQKRINNNTLGDYSDAIARIADYCTDKESLKKRIVSAMAAVIQVQRSEVTQEQRDFINNYQGYFDLKPSDFQSALHHGVDCGTATTFTANKYIESLETDKTKAQINSSNSRNNY